MAVLPILHYGSRILRKRAKLVETITPELVAFAGDMLETMYHAPGIGLAAPQAGKSIRLITVDVDWDYDEGKQNPLILFNPELVECSEETSVAEEGCLSFPDINGQVSRPERVTVKALDQHGKKIVFKDVDGLFARCLQHEMDHLDGILLVDKFSESDRWLNEGRLKKLAKKGEP